MILRLLPYALVLAGVVGLLASVPVLVGGAETQATPAELAGLTAEAPTQRWVEVTGGGFWLPGTLEDTREKNGRTRVQAVYAPYIGPEAMEAELDAGPDSLGVPHSPGDPPVVLVKFKPDRFNELFPEDEESFDAVYKEMSFSGTRLSGVRVPARLVDHLEQTLNVGEDDLVVLEFEGQPLQRGGAGLMALASLGLLTAGGLWAKKRWTPARPAVVADAGAPVDRRDEMIPPRDA